VAAAERARAALGRARAVNPADPALPGRLADLENRFPGIRFRMIDEQDRVRRHMRIFVNRVPIEDLATPVAPDDEIHIFQALSGG